MFTGDGDVEMFFFYFENVLTRNKDESEKATELLAQFGGNALQFFIAKITAGGAISDAGKNYVGVKAAFLERIARRVEPQDITGKATDATLDEKNLVQSLERLYALYTLAGFNDE